MVPLTDRRIIYWCIRRGKLEIFAEYSRSLKKSLDYFARFRSDRVQYKHPTRKSIMNLLLNTPVNPNDLYKLGGVKEILNLCEYKGEIQWHY